MNFRPSLQLVLSVVLSTGVTGCGADGPAPGSGSAVGSPVVPAQAADLPRRPLPPTASDDEPHSPVDTGSPAIGNLDPDLLAAVQEAARDATADGVQFWVTSGWRSREHQQELLDAAVEKYGSYAEALRYVSTPDKSAHVTGDAVDIGPTAADSWLAQHGSDYGLCQAFANEVWHFELATGPGGTCPAPIPDSSYR